MPGSYLYEEGVKDGIRLMKNDIWIMNPKECDLELNYEDKVCRYWMGSIVAL